jgi:hypothetical protein
LVLECTQECEDAYDDKDLSCEMLMRFSFQGAGIK